MLLKKRYVIEILLVLHKFDEKGSVPCHGATLKAVLNAILYLRGISDQVITKNLKFLVTMKILTKVKNAYMLTEMGRIVALALDKLLSDISDLEL